MGIYLDCGCYIDEGGKRTWCPSCTEGAHSTGFFAAAVRKLDRYREVPGMGMEKDNAEGQWLRRADVLALVDGTARGK